MDFQNLLTQTYFNNTIQEYLIAFCIFLVLILTFKLFKIVLLKKLKKLTQKTTITIDDFLIGILESLGPLFYITIGLYISLHYLTTTEQVTKIANYTLLIVITIYATKSINKIITYATQKIVKNDKQKQSESIIKLFSSILKATVWIIVFLLIISNLGFNITSLMAGLGIGGIAIALALQIILKDLFASLSIYLDKPFEVEDFIIIGEHMGTVKKIGLKTTRIKSLQGEEIVISNSELTSTRIQNYKKMKKRRIQFQLGLTYKTTTKKLEAIPRLVKKIFSTVKTAELDRVHFKKYGDSNLIYEIVYYIASSDYNLYMDTQQEINLKIKKEFEKQKIEFAYPTQTIIMGKN